MGIVNKDGEILANEKDVYIPPLGRGIVPTEAAQHHNEVKEKVLKQALNKTKLTLKDVNAVAYSAGPGLPPTLLIGANFALEISKKYKKQIIPTNHAVAHLEIGRLTTNAKDPVFIYLSGGNTAVVAYISGRYRIFGETEDIPVGNCFDVLAREMGLPMPGGIEIEKLAKKGNYIELPCVVKGMDVSFAGIETAAINLIRKGAKKEDVAYSLQETCFAMLTEITERAVAHTGKEEVLLVGGVAANKRLQEMMRTMCEERDAKFFVVPQEYSGDCGSMIAWTGLLAYVHKKIPKIKDGVLSRWRIDQVPWFQA